MSKKLKDKHLKAILSRGFYKVDARPAPSNEDIERAVLAHNLEYVPAGQGATQGNGASQRALPIISTSRDGHTATIGRGNDGRFVAPPQDTWTCGVADIKGCPIAQPPIVEVPIDLYRAWTELAADFATEWMAYLIGSMDATTGRGAITEMYFPPQSASGAHVEMPDEAFRVRPGTIGAVHSHNTMAAFFSQTDRDHANWPIEIVINAKGESLMSMRTKLECGRHSRIDGKVMLTGIRAADAYRDSLKAAIITTPEHRTYGSLVIDGDGYDYQYKGGHFS